MCWPAQPWFVTNSHSHESPTPSNLQLCVHEPPTPSNLQLCVHEPPTPSSLQPCVQEPQLLPISNFECMNQQSFQSPIAHPWTPNPFQSPITSSWTNNPFQSPIAHSGCQSIPISDHTFTNPHHNAFQSPVSQISSLKSDSMQTRTLLLPCLSNDTVFNNI